MLAPRFCDWKVTLNFMDDVNNPQGLCATPLHGNPDAPLPYQFRMYDDDKELCFEGYSSNDDSEAAFNPLDEYGVAFGCTEIRYLNIKTNEWETL